MAGMPASALKRFGVAIDGPLLDELDALVRERECTRSELFRDLARAEVGRAKVARGVDAVAALTIVYDHHVRDLSERLTEMQHEMGERVRAALHVHLSHDYCLEVIILRGRSDALQAAANRIMGMRGVKHGSIEIVSELWHPDDSAAHHHHPGDAHHHHPATAGGTARPSASARGRGARRAGPARTDKRARPPGPPRRGRNREA